MPTFLEEKDEAKSGLDEGEKVGRCKEDRMERCRLLRIDFDSEREIEAQRSLEVFDDE